MNQRLLIGKVILAPALVLLVLAAVAGGQIVTSLDLLHDVRSIDALQLAIRSNGEAMVRLHDSEVAFKLFQALDKAQANGANQPELKELRGRLHFEAERLRGIADSLVGTGDNAAAIEADREMVANYGRLLELLALSDTPSSMFPEVQRLQDSLGRRLKANDQAYHLALIDNATGARTEAEAAIPVAILLAVVGVMAALTASLASTRGLLSSLSDLAEAMRKLAREEKGAAEATGELGREFGEISEALELFQRTALERRAAMAALAESEEGLKRVLDAAPSPLALTRPVEGKLVYANKHCRDLFKVTGPTENLDVRQFYTNPEDRDRFVEQIRRHGGVQDYEVSMRRADGEDRWMLVSAVPITYRGETVIVLGYDDATERRALLAQLRENEERLRLIVETAPVPLVLTRVGDDTLIYVNQLTLDLFHIPEGMEVIGQPASDFWADPAGREKMKEMLVANNGRLSSVEARLKRPDGSWFWAQLSAASAEYKGEAVLMVSVEDVTRRKELEEELRRHATTDFLTGISNRRHLIDVAEREFARARRYGHTLSVLMLDIDRFKRINDTYGHPVGDKVVQAMANICKAELREIDHLGRMGGEEFAILLPETDASEALKAAERVRRAVEAAQVELDDGMRPISFTASIGASTVEAKDSGFDQTLMRADRALYRAKQAGRNCVQLPPEA